MFGGNGIIILEYVFKMLSGAIIFLIFVVALFILSWVVLLWICVLALLNKLIIFCWFKFWGIFLKLFETSGDT